MASSASNTEAAPRKRIILNAFDMFTVGHLSFGQWRRDDDRSATKRRDLSYWVNLAKVLERGDFNSLFIADTLGHYDTYKGSAEPCFRTGAQFPMADPIIPISAMASATKNLGFVITGSTSYEAPYLVARRFSTVDHLTGGRFGWNIVTSWKASAAKAVGLSLVEHDKRYLIADEYLRILYQLWEGSWADDALQEKKEDEIYVDINRIKTVNYHSSTFSVEAPHVVDPSPQRTPFLFQAGTSAAGTSFAATHAEGILVSGLSPHILAPRIKSLRDKAAAQGRDPQSIKIFAVITPIVGATDDEAQAKYEKALQYASSEGGLTFASANLGIDLSQFDPDVEISTSDVQLDSRVHSFVSNLEYHGAELPKWTPRNIGKIIAIGGNGPVPVGSPATVADFMEDWMAVADLDGFNVGYVTTPGTFEDVVDLLVPELRRRGIYAPVGESGTMRERYLGQSHVRSDHVASGYKFGVSG